MLNKTTNISYAQHLQRHCELPPCLKEKGVSPTSLYVSFGADTG